MTRSVGLFLFATDAALVHRATRAGVDAFVVDWENRGKEARQRGADTEINHDTPEDLARVRAATTARVICRINPAGPWTGDEVETAIRGGADEILVPMVRSVADAELVLRAARGRVGVGLLVETIDAVAEARRLGRLPLSRVYVGLNDLMIDRGAPNLFAAVADGTVERVRAAFDVPFGFGGLTVPEGGRPVPCRLLLAEMVRLSCSFSFLRRSFTADQARVGLAESVRRIDAGLAAAERRRATEVASDRAELGRVLAGLVPGAERVA